MFVQSSTLWSIALLTYATAAPVSVTLGSWGPTVSLPLVPAAAAVNGATGKLLFWSAYSTNTFQAGKSGLTKTCEYDPVSGAISSLTVSNTNHDMFCPGINIDFQGQLIVTGGDTAQRTSLRQAAAGDWVSGPNMTIARGYQSSTVTSDGRSFTIGGSWSGGAYGGRNGEIYDPATNKWSLLPNCPVAPMLTADKQGAFRTDNHAWLYAWKNGSVLQAGPSKAMNWYGTTGTGSQVSAGTRGADVDAMCGVNSMYDAVAGKIFSAGGSTSYQDASASRNAQVITIGAVNAPVTTVNINKLWFARIFANNVILPDGRVFIVGGQTYGVPFSDGNSSLTPEVWDPTTTRFIKWATGPTPRNYHSVALLMPNGTVMSGGGGLCGSTCTTNHFDFQLFTPPYLFAADGSLAARPTIANVSSVTPQVGSIFTITLVAKPASAPSFSLIRVSSTTHTINTDQRRIPLGAGTTADNLTYTFTLPADPGILLPGYYYSFAIVGGVPSVATTVKVTL